MLHVNASTRRAIAMRSKYGSLVTFRTADLKVSTQTADSLKAGASDLPEDVLKSWKAAADPRVFVFNPTDFSPYEVTRVAPFEGEKITWHGLIYIIAAVTFDDVGTDTHGIRVYCYKAIA